MNEQETLKTLKLSIGWDVDDIDKVWIQYAKDMVKAQQQIDYWKTSFNKQVEAGRNG